MTRIEAPWLTDAANARVFDLLEGAGHRAFYVGGCVRNALIGAEVEDVDIATDALPEAVMALAAAADGVHAVPTGIDHGTVTVVALGRPFEVTTFRRDVETDGRRAVVAFADGFDADAQRRDFTMNALYADRTGAVSDPVGGLADLAARRVRFIGDPHDRIREDALRILRFFRFHAWYGDPDGGIDAEGLAASAAHVDLLDLLSRERIGHEMRKLLSAPDPAPALASFAATGGLAHILPGAAIDLLTIYTGSDADADHDPILRLALLGGEDVADRLRLSRSEAEALTLYRREMGSGTTAGELGYRHGAATARVILGLRSVYSGGLAKASDLAEAEVEAGAAAVFPLKAADLMPALQGPALGAALKAAERRWIDSGFALTRDELLRE